MIQEVVLTLGIPGCGKSTWSEQWVLAAPMRKRINKDLLRTSLDIDRYNDDSEGFIKGIMNVILKICLEQGYSVVIDDGNLWDEYRQSVKWICEKYGAKYSIKDFTHVPLAVCLERDSWRTPKRAGEELIRKLHAQMQTIDRSI